MTYPAPSQLGQVIRPCARFICSSFIALGDIEYPLAFEVDRRHYEYTALKAIAKSAINSPMSRIEIFRDCQIWHGPRCSATISAISSRMYGGQSTRPSLQTMRPSAVQISRPVTTLPSSPPSMLPADWPAPDEILLFIVFWRWPPTVQ
jgi:hypothetical protein